MVTNQDIRRGLLALGLDGRSHVLVHSSYKAFGGVQGGPPAVVRTLVETVATVMMPAFSWRTAVWDASGLFEGNCYRPEPPRDEQPLPFSGDTPIDGQMGVIAQTFHTSYPVRRSGHPLQSFIAYGELADVLAGAGDDADDADDADVGAPVARLLDANGELLLMGVTHTASTAVHHAEQLAGRRLFVRHALTQEGIKAVVCGGCSAAFDQLQPHVEHLERRTTAGATTLRAFRLRSYVEAARDLIVSDPSALLCGCERCRATYESQVPA